MSPRQKRLAAVAALLLVLSVIIYLVLNALNSNIALYITPTQVYQGQAPKNKAFRVGGLVQEGSVRRVNTQVYFEITDTAYKVRVQYQGILPDLFRESKGVVVQGRLNEKGVLVASEVLAKHDENYMPPEAADAVMKAQQHKQESK